MSKTVISKTSSYRCYINDKQALAYFQQQATPEFWDHHWKINEIKNRFIDIADDGLFIPVIKRYLSRGSIILEGGCGRGQLLYALYHQGYQAIGIDFAQQTVQRIRESLPDIDVQVGDVRKLPVSNGYLDGYLSVGVIEHFWSGYEEIIMEMERTLRPNGYLFVSFPYMSFLRRCKGYLGLYPRAESISLADQKEQFYQYALNKEIVVADLHALGFELCEAIPFDGIKGFKDEITFFKPWLQKIYDGEYCPCFRRPLNHLFRLFASHSILLVMQKQKSKRFAA